MNTKITLSYETDVDTENYSPVKVTFDITGEQSIPQLLNHFEAFMKAITYEFDGRLKLVQEEKYEGCMADCDSVEEKGESHIFDDIFAEERSKGTKFFRESKEIRDALEKRRQEDSDQDNCWNS